MVVPEMLYRGGGGDILKANLEFARRRRASQAREWFEQRPGGGKEYAVCAERLSIQGGSLG